MTRRTIHPLRLLTVAAVVALGVAVAPATEFGNATAAHAGGDVCDICSVNFDLGACEKLGGWPYDSTQESPPPAISGGGSAPAPAPAPAAPAPAAPAPAPAAPAAPAPAAPAVKQPAAGGTANTGTQSASTTTQTTGEVAAVTATVPVAPAQLAHEVLGRSLTLTWTAPADGGSPITGYKLILNGGTPIKIAADKTSYRIALGAGTYEAALIATNAVGDSEPVATEAGIQITAASATTATQADSADASSDAAQEDEGTSPLLGIGVLGGLVVAGGALLGWWAIRRRKAAGGASSPTPL